MKKLLILSLLILSLHQGIELNATEDYTTINNTIKESLQKNCRSILTDDHFLIASGCSGGDDILYYIKDKKVTKGEYETIKTEYDTNGPICEETKSFKIGALPGDLSAECIEGKNGLYFNKGMKISYKDFQGILISMTIKSAQEKSMKEAQNLVDKQRKALESIQSFIENIKSKDSLFFSYAIVGSSCIGDGSMTYNGNGYKEMICKDKKVQSIKYILDNKEVSFDTYIESAYNAEKQMLDSMEDTSVGEKTPGSIPLANQKQETVVQKAIQLVNKKGESYKKKIIEQLKKIENKISLEKKPIFERLMYLMSK